jgi:magnesium-transporting ATPase (P-type)
VYFYLGKNACPFSHTYTGSEVCVAANGAVRFSCAASAAHFLFLYRKEEQTMLWYIVGAIVALVIAIYIAACFSDVAREKGFDGNQYFWLCLLFSIVGYLLVVALPDRKAKTTASQPFSPKPLPRKDVPPGQKACWACGHVQPMNNISCSNCGETL